MLLCGASQRDDGARRAVLVPLLRRRGVRRRPCRFGRVQTIDELLMIRRVRTRQLVHIRRGCSRSPSVNQFTTFWFSSCTFSPAVCGIDFVLLGRLLCCVCVRPGRRRGNRTVSYPLAFVYRPSSVTMLSVMVTGKAKTQRVGERLAVELDSLDRQRPRNPGRPAKRCRFRPR